MAISWLKLPPAPPPDRKGGGWGYNQRALHVSVYLFDRYGQEEHSHCPSWLLVNNTIRRPLLYPVRPFRFTCDRGTGSTHHAHQYNVIASRCVPVICPSVCLSACLWESPWAPKIGRMRLNSRKTGKIGREEEDTGSRFRRRIIPCQCHT